MSREYKGNTNQKQEVAQQKNQNNKVDYKAQQEWLSKPDPVLSWGIGSGLEGYDNVIQKKEDNTANKESDNNTPATHGVTHTKTTLVYFTKNSKTKKKSKELEIPKDSVVHIIDDSNETNLKVRITIGTDVYEGTLARTAVNITPNNLSEINKSTSKQIVKQTSSGSGAGTKAKDICNIHYAGGIPQEISPYIDSELDGQVSSGNSLAISNKTVTLPITFYFSHLPADIVKKYDNKTFAYRFTRFNNGKPGKTNTKDIILVEELGELTTKQALTKDEKEDIGKLFTKYNIGFLEPGADAAQANADLRTKLGDPNVSNDELEALHDKALLPLSNVEKDAIYSSIGKLKENVLNDIKGLKFGKRFCKLEIQNGRMVADTPNAYYFSADHAVTLVKASGSTAKDIFGDNGNENFINRLEFTILHETGHALDYKPYLEDEKEYQDIKNEKEATLKTTDETLKKLKENKKKAKKKYENNKTRTNAVNYQKHIDKVNKYINETKNPLVGDYNNYINDLIGKKITTSSGSGNEIVNNNQGWYKDYSTDTDFTIALRADSPNITEYSNDNVKEAYAEAFALYISEPNSLKALSPNVYAYFNTRYPQ